jgi:hypothetical protein
MKIESIGAARMLFGLMECWIRFVGIMRMQDVENLQGRRTWIALAWVVPAAIMLSATLLPMLRKGGMLSNWIPSPLVSIDAFEGIVLWVCITIGSSGFLAVEACRWQHRLSQSTVGLLTLALVFFCVHSAMAYAVLVIIYGSFDNAWLGL